MIQLTGKILDAKFNAVEKNYIVSFAVENVSDAIDELKDKKLSITVKQEAKRRSLDSNAYFHKLVDELRQKLKLSFIRMKHILITSYGQILYINDEMQIVHSDLPIDYVMEHEFYDEKLSLHFSPIGTDENGLTVYRLYRGSHTYSTAEMAQLIEGTIFECKQQGIETATPEELAKMQAVYERRYHAN